MSTAVGVAALSDLGCVRTNNEDNFGYDPTLDIYVVCDGMGGMAAGEVASAIACATVIETFAAQPEETAPEVRLSLAIRAANDAVCRESRSDKALEGMGTTLVAAVLRGSRLLVGNVGDSRAYMLHGGQCVQLTVDHSYINELVRLGMLPIEQLHDPEFDQYRNVITRAIGAAAEVQPDFYFVDMLDGDAVLLASDGLTRYVDAAALIQLVQADNLPGSCQRLIDAARNGGGEDNITCLILVYHPAAEVADAAPTEPVPSQ